jgi:hypothetical protein
MIEWIKNDIALPPTIKRLPKLGQKWHPGAFAWDTLSMELISFWKMEAGSDPHEQQRVTRKTVLELKT